jgi:hypothetical protein
MTKAKNEHGRKKTKAIIISIVVILVIYIVALVNPVTGPHFRYPYYRVFCGREPVVTSSIMGKYYYTPDMKSYRVIGLGGGLYCTENEARSHGYSKSLAQ